MNDPASDPSAPFDRIRIKDLALRCIVGINPEERIHKQDVSIQLTLFVDLSLAARSDAIGDTVDYKVLKKRIVEAVEGSSFFLVERLAGMIAGLCLEDPRVRAVEVEVEKPGALRFARTVSVTILRHRESEALARAPTREPQA
jgi:D-erythro-7,8-dihydroneopterin triphosphate epimerase